MPTWGQILNELVQTRLPNGNLDYDTVRRRYLQNLHSLTGRAVILYSAAFLESKPRVSPGDVQISLEDMQGFMQAVSNIEERQLDLIIHSPGGTAEAAESIVEYLRQRFDHIRVFVPLAAMSAATMIALSADEIFMGQHSQLGPIDPQFILSTPEGPRSGPAKAILKQFDMAKADCQDARNLPVWLPIIRSYLAGLIPQCLASQQLAETMVKGWLERYMFRGDPKATQKSAAIAGWFGNYDNFNSHGRRVGFDQAHRQGLKVTRLESDNALQDAVLSVHHATMHTFQGAASKIIENHHGLTWAKLFTPLFLQPGQPPTTSEGPARQLAPSAQPLNRQQRRQQERQRGR